MGCFHAVEYYSATKRNEFESVAVSWMNLEPVIQREVSQKEKNKYRILTHTWNQRDGTDDPVCRAAKQTQT